MEYYLIYADIWEMYTLSKMYLSICVGNINLSFNNNKFIVRRLNK